MDKDFIISYLPKRDDIVINNKYEIIKNYEYLDDFHIVVYYIEKYKCKIIIRRLDEETGWGLDLLINIYDFYNNDIKEIISIGSSEYNEKIIYIYTHIELKPIYYDSKQKIPKKIIQTSRTNKYNSLLHYNAVQTFIELNPEYEYYFFTDIECREFIKNNFEEELLYTYDMLLPGAYKADLFRYCYLYINGGCYFDNKAILRIPLRDIIEKDFSNIYCKDNAEDLMFNAVIMTDKLSEDLRKSYEEVVQNVKSRFYGITPLDPTGPKLFNKYTNDKNVILKHFYHGKYYTGSKVIIQNDKLLLNTHYKGYYYNQTIKRDDYNDMFFKKEIYCKDYIKCNEKYIILQYPSVYDDRFNYNIIDDNTIKIIRTDKDEGWGQHLKIKIINNLTNEEIIKYIGPSNINNIEIKIFSKD
jgi:mannosyltransferase OCH1-like enzyme